MGRSGNRAFAGYVLNCRGLIERMRFIQPLVTATAAHWPQAGSQSNGPACNKMMTLQVRPRFSFAPSLDGDRCLVGLLHRAGHGRRRTI